ncbi:hypothetical protein ABTM60_19320, partial [Acinetobacter baumannii]
AAEEALASMGESASAEEPQALDINVNESMPDELPVDSAWEDVFAGGSITGVSSSGGEDDDNPLESRNASPETLYDTLLWQLNLTPFSDVDR